MTLRRTLLAFFAILALATPARAQDPNSQPPAPNLPATINVYLDCNFCDFDYIRTEIPYVNWVRDRAVSDLHILATSQSTGGGGVEFVFNFIGLREFAQKADTLKSVSTVGATGDDQRRGHVRTMKTGLVPFLSRTALASRLQISLAPAAAGAAAAATQPQNDPWHGWVMAFSANSFTNGEKSYSYLNGYFDGQAKRITEKWKSVAGGDFSYDDSKSTVELGNAAGTGDTTYVTIKRNWSSYASQFRGINEHWSAGLTGSLGSNTYSNQARYARAKAAIEYNLFPYKESTRRQLRAQYGIGMANYRYEDTTIYLKIQETVPIHFLGVAMSARQPWGSMNANLTHNALLLDGSKRSTRLYGNANVRIAKGLSFYVGGEYDWIHDQLYLRKGTASTANVLLRQQALKTSYSYYGNFGISYTFGSIFNNIVFPRFNGSNTF